MNRNISRSFQACPYIRTRRTYSSCKAARILRVDISHEAPDLQRRSVLVRTKGRPRISKQVRSFRVTRVLTDVAEKRIRRLLWLAFSKLTASRCRRFTKAIETALRSPPKSDSVCDSPTSAPEFGDSAAILKRNLRPLRGRCPVRPTCLQHEYSLDLGLRLRRHDLKATSDAFSDRQREAVIHPVRSGELQRAAPSDAPRA